MVVFPPAFFPRVVAEFLRFEACKEPFATMDALANSVEAQMLGQRENCDRCLSHQ
jgi:hypothetical protein